MCDENRHLSEMYEEIRLSPLAVQLKKDYESQIAALHDKLDDLQGDYDHVCQKNKEIVSEMNLLQQE